MTTQAPQQRRRRGGLAPALSSSQTADIKTRLKAGSAVAAIARDIKVSRQIIMRVRDGV